MSQDEVINLTYCSPLPVNVRVPSYFVEVQVQLALERVHRVRKSNVFWQNVPRGRHSIEKEVCSLARYLMFALGRAEMDVYGLYCFATVLVFCFRHTSLPSLDHAQSCRSV